MKKVSCTILSMERNNCMSPSIVPTISFVILTFNNWELTYSCLTTLLQSFEESHLKRGIQIIVVDNGSTDEARQKLNAFATNYSLPAVQLRLVMLDENVGYPSGVNIGLAHCTGTIIGVLNNDLEFPKGWLTPLIHTLEADKLVGFAAPFLSYAPSVQNLQKAFTSYKDMQNFATDFMSNNAGELFFTDRVIGACLLFRRDLLVSIGGNDFWYGIGNFDDDDWCIRARIAGYKIAVVGGSFVHHIGHASFRLEPVQYHMSLEINAEKFARKWKIPGPVSPTNENTRNDIVKQTKFDRAQHFIPFQSNDFSSWDIPNPNFSLSRRWLICADWTSSQSGWTSLFTPLLLSGEQVELIFWVPKSLFDVEAIVAQIQRSIASSPVPMQPNGITFKVFQDVIPYVNIPKLLHSHDAVVKVPHDFVNRYIVQLALQMDMNIVDIPAG
jgi:GT2 family glycosyltransferase